MKYLVLVPLVLVTSCASRPEFTVYPLPSPAVDPVESVRYAEVLRTYHVGRYVDPNHPETMQEEHPVYRIEVSGRWNLHPGCPNDVGLLNPPPDAAFAPPPTNDVVIAEMNRQREGTALVMRQAVRLSQSFEELQKVVSEMKAVARNNALLNARLSTAEQRLAGFEKEMQRITTTPASTNDIPAFTPEASDSSKP